MKKIETEKAPAAIGPYAQAYETNGFVFTSGQLPVNPLNGEMPEAIRDQTELSCKNVEAILEEAGTSMNNVIKTTCFLSDMANFAEFNKVYAEYFPGNPARSCFAVKELPKGALCEIEAVALVNNK